VSSMMEPAIEVSDFFYHAGGKNILCGVSMSVPRGDYVSIIGPNGAGKTTLLKCLNRVLTGGQGQIRVLGRPLARYTQKQLALAIGYVPQADGRRHPFSVTEFVMMGRYPHLSPFTSPSAADHEAVRRALDMTDAAVFAERAMTTLSGGESQRVHIAAALAQEAPILLLDEPTTFLDPQHQSDIARILRRVNREENVTVCTVTHDINAAALSSAHVIALREGSVVYAGPPEGMMTATVLAAVYGKRFDFAPHPATGMAMVLPEGPE
jgi:iron complex transport system ATP-binding protein